MELKRQRVKPEFAVGRDYMPYLLLIGAVSSSFYYGTLGATIEV